MAAAAKIPAAKQRQRDSVFTARHNPQSAKASAANQVLAKSSVPPSMTAVSNAQPDATALPQRWGSAVASGCALLTAVMLGGTELFANTWFAALAFALCGLCLAVKTESRWRCFAAGILAAAAILSRSDLGPAVVLAFLPLFLLMEPKARCAFLIGGVIGLLALVWFAIAVGPRQLIYSLFLFPVFHLSSAAYFPISTAP